MKFTFKSFVGRFVNLFQSKRSFLIALFTSFALLCGTILILNSPTQFSTISDNSYANGEDDNLFKERGRILTDRSPQEADDDWPVHRDSKKACKTVKEAEKLVIKKFEKFNALIGITIRKVKGSKVKVQKVATGRLPGNLFIKENTIRTSLSRLSSPSPENSCPVISTPLSTVQEAIDDLKAYINTELKNDFLLVVEDPGTDSSDPKSEDWPIASLNFTLEDAQKKIRRQINEIIKLYRALGGDEQNPDPATKLATRGPSTIAEALELPKIMINHINRIVNGIKKIFPPGHFPAFLKQGTNWLRNKKNEKSPLDYSLAKVEYARKMIGTYPIYKRKFHKIYFDFLGGTDGNNGGNPEQASHKVDELIDRINAEKEEFKKAGGVTAGFDTSPTAPGPVDYYHPSFAGRGSSASGFYSVSLGSFKRYPRLTLAQAQAKVRYQQGVRQASCSRYKEQYDFLGGEASPVIGDDDLIAICTLAEQQQNNKELWTQARFLASNKVRDLINLIKQEKDKFVKAGGSVEENTANNDNARNTPWPKYEEDAVPTLTYNEAAAKAFYQIMKAIEEHYIFLAGETNDGAVPTSPTTISEAKTKLVTLKNQVQARIDYFADLVGGGLLPSTIKTPTSSVIIGGKEIVDIPNISLTDINARIIALENYINVVLKADFQLAVPVLGTSGLSTADSDDGPDASLTFTLADAQAKINYEIGLIENDYIALCQADRTINCGIGNPSTISEVFSKIEYFKVQQKKNEFLIAGGEIWKWCDHPRVAWPKYAQDNSLKILALLKSPNAPWPSCGPDNLFRLTLTEAIAKVIYRISLLRERFNLLGGNMIESPITGDNSATADVAKTLLTDLITEINKQKTLYENAGGTEGPEDAENGDPGITGVEAKQKATAQIAQLTPYTDDEKDRGAASAQEEDGASANIQILQDKFEKLRGEDAEFVGDGINSETEANKMVKQVENAIAKQKDKYDRLTFGKTQEEIAQIDEKLKGKPRVFTGKLLFALPIFLATNTNQQPDDVTLSDAKVIVRDLQRYIDETLRARFSTALGLENPTAGNNFAINSKDYPRGITLLQSENKIAYQNADNEIAKKAVRFNALGGNDQGSPVTGGSPTTPTEAQAKLDSLITEINDLRTQFINAGGTIDEKNAPVDGRPNKPWPNYLDDVDPLLDIKAARAKVNFLQTAEAIDFGTNEYARPVRGTETNNLGAIIGGVVGGIVFLALLILSVIYGKSRLKTRKISP